MLIIRGLLPVLVLYILTKEGKMHGYMIKKKIEEITKKELPQGMIYTLLRRMENDGLIVVINGKSDRNRKVYDISLEGREYLKRHVIVLKKIVFIINTVINFVESASS